MLLSKRGGKRWGGSVKGGKQSKRWVYFRSYKEYRQAQGLPVTEMHFAGKNTQKNNAESMWHKSNRVVKPQTTKKRGPEVVLKFKGNLSKGMDYERQLERMKLKPNLQATGPRFGRWKRTQKAREGYKTPKKAGAGTKATSQVAWRQPKRRFKFLQLSAKETKWFIAEFWDKSLKDRIKKGFKPRWIKLAGT
jgi:hypothetical protein